MPYIVKSDDRDYLEQSLVGISLHHGAELNYAICTLIDRFFECNALRYNTIAEVLAALEGAKLEFVRRVVNPYEQSKLEINGDVFPYAVNQLKQDY